MTLGGGRNPVAASVCGGGRTIVGELAIGFKTGAYIPGGRAPKDGGDVAGCGEFANALDFFGPELQAEVIGSAKGFGAQ